MKRILPITSKRIVVKVGSGILTCKNLRLDKSWIKKLVGQIAALVNKDRQVILVTSGAIGAGMGMLKLDCRPKLLPPQQAAAAIGQSQLMKIYDTFFKSYNILTAQILLTSDDLSNRKRYLNAKNTLFTLLSYGVIAIINENDTVSVDEIKFGDNDRLSSLVAALVHADLLIILSDVYGLYAHHPKAKGDKRGKKIISVVQKIGPEIEKMAAAGKSKLGTGGMITKLQAAKICCASGIACVIAHGKTSDVLLKIINGENVGTLFLPQKRQLVAKKRWIGFSSKVNGQLFVDQGAKEALAVKKKSLLPKGVVKIKGGFSVGDTVTILDIQGREFARGLTNYSATELAKIKGQKTDQIQAILGYKHYDEVVHRDNLVIL